MDEIILILHSIRFAKKTNNKLNILKQHSNNQLLKQILYYTYNPYYKYGINKTTINKMNLNSQNSQNVFNANDLFNLLQELQNSNITNALRLKVYHFLNNYTQYQELIIQILLKDLKLNIAIKSINKVFPSLIPEFNVMLAKQYIDRVEHIVNEKIVITEKLDGVRCVIIKKDNSSIMYSRQGNIINGCSHILDSVNNMNINNYVFDGELLLNTEITNSGDTFRQTTQIVNSKQDSKQNLVFHCFDGLPVDEFMLGESIYQYDKRRAILQDVIEINNCTTLVPILYQGYDKNNIEIILHNMLKNHKEGIMINLYNGTYQCKRSNNILKYKNKNTIDLRIIGFKEGQGKYQGMLGALEVMYYKHPIYIGSGLSDNDRQYIWNNQSLYLNSIIEIAYTEISQDNTGKRSLRFPRFIRVRDDKTEESYY